MSEDDEADGVVFVDPPQDLLCGICHEIARDAHVTDDCGHLFCKRCIDEALAHAERCPVCRKPRCVTRRDLRASRQIGGLAVRCANPPCAWEGEAAGAPKHAAGCAHRPQPCGFAAVGCPARVSQAAQADHDETQLRPHLQLVVAEAAAASGRLRDADRQRREMLSSIESLREEITTLKDLARQQRDDMAALQVSAEKERASMRGDVLELRRNFFWPRAGSSFCGTVTGQGFGHRWRPQPYGTTPVQGAFELSDDGMTATKAYPGWGTVCHLSGLCRGKHALRFLVHAQCSTYVASTVMIGVTVDTYSTGRHLGNTETAWSFQGNGFRWDGVQCYAYGSACESGDVLGMTVDLDEGVLSFSRNGHDFGVAFYDVRGLVYPAASLCTKGHSITLLVEDP
ncbi:hypothetical protein DIPPA_31493 [Diplonema papillatum]|nr:hypothetical protein DIPPA_31493 [Diplonema papillatum]